MSEDRAEYHLVNWGNWVRKDDDNGLGYKISTIYGVPFITCWDDVEDSVDATSAITSNAIIDGMEEREQLVLSNHYVSAVFTFRRERSYNELEEAKGRFWLIASRRGLV